MSTENLVCQAVSDPYREKDYQKYNRCPPFENLLGSTGNIDRYNSGGSLSLKFEGSNCLGS